MTERERLIRLIGEIKSYEHGGMTTVTDEGLADYLLANGVFLTPCKKGDTVYLVLKGCAEVLEGRVRKISLNHNSELIVVVERFQKGYYTTGNHKWSSFGKTVFLNKEDAEKALATK